MCLSANIKLKDMSCATDNSFQVVRGNWTKDIKTSKMSISVSRSYLVIHHICTIPTWFINLVFFPFFVEVTSL